VRRLKEAGWLRSQRNETATLGEVAVFNLVPVKVKTEKATRDMGLPFRLVQVRARWGGLRTFRGDRDWLLVQRNGYCLAAKLV
jgi:hypothetical protein